MAAPRSPPHAPIDKDLVRAKTVEQLLRVRNFNPFEVLGYGPQISFEQEMNFDMNLTTDQSKTQSTS